MSRIENMTIAFYEEPPPMPQEQSYTINKPHDWLDRIILWAVSKRALLSPFFDLTPIRTWTYTRDMRKQLTVDLVRELGDQLYDYGKRPQDYTLIVGRDYFRDLTFNMRPQDFVVYAGPIDHGGYQMRLDGIPIHVVSTISGFGMIPKVLVERTVRK
jgi:hypothetical protein